MVTNKQRISFFFCVFSGLFLGTNYCFSSWAPQISKRCRLSSLEINLIGISGNLGVYLISPLSGRLVDKTGQRIPLLLAAIALFLGYYGLHAAYEDSWQNSARLLCTFSFLTGIGSSLGNSAALNACAKSHPLHRGTATAFPIAAYGLSAFVFSRVSYLVFPGETGKFLLALSLSCGIALGTSSCFIGVHGPIVGETSSRKSNDGDTEESGTLLGDDESAATIPSDVAAETIAEITGFSLLLDRDFQFMIVTLALLSGSGLLYINNIGANLTALVRAEFAPEPFPLLLLERLQAFNVSLLSIMNCSGRIFAGLTSDYLKHNYGLQRSVFLVLSSVLFILGCFLISFNSTSTYVVWCTSILGFSYGCLFGIGPVLTSELFGLENFSSNWGFMSVAPGISGNLFNLLYGKVYDLHSNPITHECSQGLACYRSAFITAALGALVAFCTAAKLYTRHRAAAQALNDIHD